MKKFISSGFIVCIVFSLLIGCKKEKSDIDIPPGTMLGYTTPKDTRLNYTITKGDGKGSHFTQTVSNFKDSSGYRVATITTTIPGSDPVSSSILYNRDQTIVHSAIPAVYYTMMDMISPQFTTFTHQENPGTMAVPHKAQAGAVISAETLVAGYHGIQMDGNSKTEATFNITNHPAVVKGEESITTSLGTFQCIKIEQQTTIVSKMIVDNMVVNDSKKTTTVMTWLSKGIGVVRTQELDGSVIVSESDLTKID